MKFVGQPSDVPARTIMTPAVVVELKDSGDSEVVTISLALNKSGATLFGTLSRATVAGKATFDNLSLDMGGYFQLVAVVDKYEVLSDHFHVS